MSITRNINGSYVDNDVFESLRFCIHKTKRKKAKKKEVIVNIYITFSFETRWKLQI